MPIDAERRRLRLPETGIEIALLDWGGEGPLALLHHANGFCAGLWDLVARPLRSHFRVIGMDARGHGDSSKPEGAEHYAWSRFVDDAGAVARALAAEHGGGRVGLGLGHSFGGTSLMAAAALDGTLFERLVAVDPVLLPPPAQTEIDPERLERSHRLVEGAAKRRHLFPSRAEARAHYADRSLFQRWDPRALDLYVAEALGDRPDGQVELKCPGAVEGAVFAGGRDFDVWSVAPRLSVPTLLLWASAGDFPRAVYERFVASIPDARIRDVEAGHLVPMEQPALVVEQTLAFVGIQSTSTG